MNELNSSFRQFDEHAWKHCNQPLSTFTDWTLCQSLNVCRVRHFHAQRAVTNRSHCFRNPASNHRAARKEVRLRKRKKSLIYVILSIFKVILRHADMSDKLQESDDPH